MSQIWAIGGLTDLGDAMFCQKKAFTRAVEWAGALCWWNWSARSVIVNATVTQYTSCQRRLTADWLAPGESDCSRMGSKVFSNRLPSYIKATRPALEIFKMAAYFPDSPRINKRKPTVRNAVQAPHLSNRNDGVRHATSLNYSSSSPIQTPSKHIF